MAHDSLKQPRCPYCGAYSSPMRRTYDATCIQCGSAAVKHGKNLLLPVPAVPQMAFPQYSRPQTYRCKGPEPHLIHTVEIYSHEVHSKNRVRRMVKKRDGSIEPFSVAKLYQSVRNAGEEISDNRAGEVVHHAMWYLDRVDQDATPYAEFDAEPRSADFDGHSPKHRTLLHGSETIGACILMGIHQLVGKPAYIRYFLKHKGFMDDPISVEQLIPLLAKQRRDQTRLLGSLGKPETGCVIPMTKLSTPDLIRSPTEHRCHGPDEHRFYTVEIAAVGTGVHGTSQTNGLSGNIRRLVEKASGELQVFNLGKIAWSIAKSRQKPIDHLAWQTANTVFALLEMAENQDWREVRVPRPHRARVFRIRIIKTKDIAERCMYLLGALHGSPHFLRYYLIHMCKHDLDVANQFLLNAKDKYGAILHDLRDGLGDA